MQAFRDTGAYLTGHFRLTSGLHSNEYLQCARVLQHTALAESMGCDLAVPLMADAHTQIGSSALDMVVSPAIGGLIIGHEVARGLGVRAIFVERDRSGQMALRRGFELKPGEKTLVIEDVWTTGGSTRETIGVVEQEGGLAVASGAIIDRSGGRLELNVPSRALLELDVPSYEPDECPQCRAGDTASRPGSRFSRSQP